MCVLLGLMYVNGYVCNVLVELYCFCVVVLGLILYGYLVGVMNVMFILFV